MTTQVTLKRRRSSRFLLSKRDDVIVRLAVEQQVAGIEAGAGGDPLDIYRLWTRHREYH
jgi:hypothetical protein